MRLMLFLSLLGTGIQQIHCLLHPAKRSIQTELSTCGYETGDPDKIRTADSGFNCRIDTRNGLWGFCPTSVIDAADCGLAASCVDEDDCSTGCGETATEDDLTAFTCRDGSFCSTALLTFGIDQTYTYIACGPNARTDHYHITPTLVETTSSSSSESTLISTSTSASLPSTIDSQSEPLPSSTRASPQISSTETSTVPSESAAERETINTVGGVTDEGASEEEESSSEQSGSSPPIGAIIGGAVGGLAIICGSAVAVIYLLRRGNRKRNPTPPPEPAPFQTTTPWFQPEQPKAQDMTFWEPQELPGGGMNYQGADRVSPRELPG